MSTDSMPILPETDPASDRWAIQDSNGGKCLQDMGSEVVFESIRISKCLLNESTDRRCGDKPALKMKIVLADKKDKSEISPSPVRTHEEDEDTDIIEDESDSSSELTIVDDTKTDKPPSDQEQMKRKSPKEGRRKRKAREAQDPKSHAVKKRREEREAEKRRAEEIFKTQENEAMAKRIQMEFSNLRRFRTPATPDSSSKTGSNPPPDPGAQKREVSSKLPSRESSPQADPMPPKSSTENSAALARSLESVSVVIPSNENLRLMARNGSVSSSTPQSDASCSDKLRSDRKDSFLVSSTPSPGKHHIPIGLLPAPTTLHSALGSSHQSTGGAKRESPRQSPRNSPDTSPRVLPDQMNPKVTIDLARSPEPSQTMVSNASHCPGPPPPTIHIPGPLCLTDQHTPKLLETPSESQSEAAGQNRGSPKVHVSSQSESSIATRTSPPSFYSTPPPLSVEVPLTAGYQPSSNRGQPHAVPHSRSRTQNQFGNPASNTDTNRALEGQTKFKTSTATDVDKLSNAVFNPKFSAFSVDNLTKIDIRGRDKSRSSPSDLTKESPRTTQASYEVTSPSGALKEKQTTPRVVEDPNSSTEKVRVVRQSEFEFARPQAAPRKSRMKTSSPPPLSSSGSAPPFCAAATPGNINGQNSESKSALIWRYIQDQSGTNTMQTIDSALESVRASSNCLKQDDSSTILANYLQGQRKEESSDDVARERPVSPDTVLQSRDPRSLYLTKLKKMLVTLQKFSTTISMEVGKAVYHNIYALASGANNVEEFIAKTQRATKLALKPYVGPFLASYLPLLQKEITVKAASVRMSSSRYMRSNPECLIDPVVEPGDPHEVFVSEFDIPNKKKSLPQPPPPTPNMLAAHIPVQNATTDHLANSRLSLEMHDSDPRYQTHLTIQNDLLLIQEMLDRISKMVESTKRTLSTLQEESSASGCRDVSAQSSPCCSPVVSAHVSPPSCALSPKDLATSLGRLETYSKSPPRYTSNAQNFSSCNAQQKNATYLQSAIMASRPAMNELSRAGLMNCGNQTQKDSIMRLELRNQQVTHSMPPAASSSYSMRPSSEQGSSSMHKGAALNSSPNPPMPVASMAYGPPDVLVSRSELLQKELGASNHRESIPVLSSSTMQSYPATNAADKKYQESLQLKSSTNVISKNPVNLSSPQRLISQPANIGDPECCWNCGRSAQETCSGCKLAKYCGLFCQHRDWEIHHRVCRLIGTNSPRSSNQH